MAPKNKPESPDSPDISVPAKVAAKRKEEPAANKSRRRLRELTTLISNVAEAKGWVPHIATKDEKYFKYATLSVSRTTPGSYQEVTANFEVTCDDRVRITYHNTSFYNWGLKDLFDAINNEFFKLPWIKKQSKTSENSAQENDMALLERFLRRFHRIARQLKHRYADRSGITIEDEYDVQDVVHSMLRGLFDDIRPEEYTPSYAGGASRMDFLLKSEQIVIETKMASPSLRDKQVGEQLIVDIERYQVHPDCKRLICFVYDPGGNIRNPNGLEVDLTKPRDKLEVKVIVVSP